MVSTIRYNMIRNTLIISQACWSVTTHLGQTTSRTIIHIMSPSHQLTETTLKRFCFSRNKTSWISQKKHLGLTSLSLKEWHSYLHTGWSIFCIILLSFLPILLFQDHIRWARDHTNNGSWPPDQFIDLIPFPYQWYLSMYICNLSLEIAKVAQLMYMSTSRHCYWYRGFRPSD